MVDHWKGLGILQAFTFIWPDPRDLLFGGSKLQQQMNLRSSMAKLGRPHVLSATVLSATGQKINKLRHEIWLRNRTAVIKREYSQRNAHVYTPHRNENSNDPPISNDLSKGVFPQPMWFIQPYIAPMIDMGKLCLFIVNGTIIHTISSTPCGSNINDTEQMSCLAVRPLALME
jgi:hypothetical protein